MKEKKGATNKCLLDLFVIILEYNDDVDSATTILMIFCIDSNGHYTTTTTMRSDIQRSDDKKNCSLYELDIFRR
ncbi:hypothetical protein DERF_001172 [Dermatophagoides farinae]|uniref:Uncharacterized protein n=1 Tax=Dermatophagoides farinae TaxID=6954 RepID=A0A922I8Y5_DERFA|nr:hypothetical protein DERF_001172 [Dermatophagoides farinae]